MSKIQGRKPRLPSVPIFANWLQVGYDLYDRNLVPMACKFGENYLLRMFQHILVVVSSPTLARFVAALLSRWC